MSNMSGMARHIRNCRGEKMKSINEIKQYLYSHPELDVIDVQEEKQWFDKDLNTMASGNLFWNINIYTAPKHGSNDVNYLNTLLTGIHAFSGLERIDTLCSGKTSKRDNYPNRKYIMGGITDIHLKIGKVTEYRKKEVKFNPETVHIVGYDACINPEKKDDGLSDFDIERTNAMSSNINMYVSIRLMPEKNFGKQILQDDFNNQWGYETKLDSGKDFYYINELSKYLGKKET